MDLGAIITIPYKNYLQLEYEVNLNMHCGKIRYTLHVI